MMPPLLCHVDGAEEAIGGLQDLGAQAGGEVSTREEALAYLERLPASSLSGDE